MKNIDCGEVIRSLVCCINVDGVIVTISFKESKREREKEHSERIAEEREVKFLKPILKQIADLCYSAPIENDIYLGSHCMNVHQKEYEKRFVCVRV